MTRKQIFRKRMEILGKILVVITFCFVFFCFAFLSKEVKNQKQEKNDFHLIKTVDETEWQSYTLDLDKDGCKDVAIHANFEIGDTIFINLKKFNNEN